MKKFTKILVTMLIILSMLGCSNNHERKVYHEKGSKNYSYQDEDLIWHYFVYNQLLGSYAESTSTTSPISLDNSTVSYESVQETTTETSMSESSGEDVGGSESSSESSSESDSGGMSESSGSDAGGSDSSGGDSGGGDGGGE